MRKRKELITYREFAIDYWDDVKRFNWSHLLYLILAPVWYLITIHIFWLFLTIYEFGVKVAARVKAVIGLMRGRR